MFKDYTPVIVNPNFHPCAATDRLRALPQHTWAPKAIRQPMVLDTPEKIQKRTLLNRVRFKEEIDEKIEWRFTQAQDGSCVASISIGGDLKLSHTQRITESIYNLLAEKQLLDDKAIYSQKMKVEKKEEKQKKDKKKSVNKNATNREEEYFISFPYFERYSIADLERLVVLFQQSFIHQNAKVRINNAIGEEPCCVKIFYSSVASDVLETANVIDKQLTAHKKGWQSTHNFSVSASIDALKYTQKKHGKTLPEGHWRQKDEAGELNLAKSKVKLSLPSRFVESGLSTQFKLRYIRSLKECGILLAEYNEVKNNCFLNCFIQSVCSSKETGEEYLIVHVCDLMIFNACVVKLDMFLTDCAEVQAAYFKKIDANLYMMLEINETYYSQLTRDKNFHWNDDKKAIGIKLFDYDAKYKAIVKAHTVHQSATIDIVKQRDSQLEKVKPEIESHIVKQLEIAFNLFNQLMKKSLFQAPMTMSINSSDLEKVIANIPSLSSELKITMQDLENKEEQAGFEEQLKNTFTNIIPNRKTAFANLKTMWLVDRIQCILPFELQNAEIDLLLSAFNAVSLPPDRCVELQKESTQRILILKFKSPYDLSIFLTARKPIQIKSQLSTKASVSIAPAVTTFTPPTISRTQDEEKPSEIEIEETIADSDDEREFQAQRSNTYT